MVPRFDVDGRHPLAVSGPGPGKPPRRSEVTEPVPTQHVDGLTTLDTASVGVGGATLIRISTEDIFIEVVVGVRPERIVGVGVKRFRPMIVRSMVCSRPSNLEPSEPPHTRKFALYRRVDKAPIANPTLLTALVLILACTACHITRISKMLRCCIICSELSLAQIVPPAVRLFGFA